MAYFTAKQKQRDASVRLVEATVAEVETALASFESVSQLWDDQPAFLLARANALVKRVLDLPYGQILAGLDGHDWESGRRQLLALQDKVILARNEQAAEVLGRIWEDSSEEPQEERERRIVEALLPLPCRTHVDLPPVMPLRHMNTEVWSALISRHERDGSLRLDVWVEARAQLRDKAESAGIAWGMPDLI